MANRTASRDEKKTDAPPTAPRKTERVVALGTLQCQRTTVAPGEIVALPKDEVARLLSRGVVRRTTRADAEPGDDA